MRPPALPRHFAQTSFSHRVRVPRAWATTHARTSFGRISRIAGHFNGRVRGDTLNGTIGSGGCHFNSTDSNGSIEIAKLLIVRAFILRPARARSIANAFFRKACRSLREMKSGEFLFTRDATSVASLLRELSPPIVRKIIRNDEVKSRSSFEVSGG